MEMDCLEVDWLEVDWLCGPLELRMKSRLRLASLNSALLK